MHKNFEIENTIFLNYDDAYLNKDLYPNFQEKLLEFKKLVSSNYTNSLGKTYFKFGDGDYYFLKKKSFGSARPGRRAIKKPYYLIPHGKFRKGAFKNDYYLNRIETPHQDMFFEAFNTTMDFPSEFVYGLTANKWFLEKYSSNIGIIGADKKLEIISLLMEKEEYKDYLKLDYFADYISIPQKYAVDKISKIEKEIKKSLEISSSKIFLVGIGHIKSGLLYKLKEYKKDVQFIDIGVGMDAIAGIVNHNRPYFGKWKNYRLKNKAIYQDVDFLIRKDKVSEIVTHKFI